MSSRLKFVTAISIAVVTFTGALGFCVQHGITSAFIALPDESVRLRLIPLRSAPPRLGDPACCKNPDR